jgi:uncharacterized protein (DUF1800 family)
VPRTALRRATLSSVDRHLARRFSGGISPDLTASIKAAGGGRAWFERQLRPGKVPDPDGDAVDSWFPALKRTPEQIFDRQENDVQGGWEVMYDLSRWTVSRRILSSRQLLEVMTDFWSNLLNVPIMDDEAWFHRVDYDRLIRTYALDSFENLITRTTVHPSMGLYLDNAVSTKDAPNENLGRELLELHTVGVDADYTEDDVKASSKLLTGYRVDLWWPRFRSFYDESRHYTGPITVMGFSHPNSDRDGRAATQAYLSYLARHPATAARIARRLCTRFVSDTPSQGIVDAVAAAYTANRTAIKPTLRALVDHPDFLASAGSKVRTPTEDYVATVRALRIKPVRPTREASFANAMYWQYGELGHAPYEWPAPNGYPEVGAAWTSAGRVLNGMSLHLDLAGGWWPSKEARFRNPADWLPALPATLDEVVGHVGKQLLGQQPSAQVRAGVARALDLAPTKRMRKGDLWDFRVLAILASLLDSPTHLMR